METRWEIKRIDSKLYAFIIAILPCIMMYKVPILEKGAATIMALSCAVLIIFSFHHVDLQSIKILIPGIIYVIYIIFRSIGNWIEIILQISAFINLYAICSGAMNISALRRYIVRISLFAAICVLLQSFIHALMNIHIPMIAYNLCLNEIKRYTAKILTGMSEGIYRPSAFFLEPAHMARYLMVGLAFCLLDRIKDYKKALVISLGILITTSGMGLAILVCIWGWFYFAEVNQNKSNKLKIILYGAVITLFVVGITTSIPGVQHILARIFGSFGNETSDYNAINGRLFWWDTYFSNLQGVDLFIGKGSNAIPDDYFTGFMELLYAYGIIGVSLYYYMLIYILRKSNNAFSSCIIFLSAGLMFFANLTGFIHTIFNIGTILAVIKEDMRTNKTDNLLHIRDNKYQYIR